MKDKGYPQEEHAIHKIRITLTSKNVRSLEKGEQLVFVYINKSIESRHVVKHSV